MGKVSPVSIKYMVNATARLDGVVEKPDIIGAIFGQTEGLLGKDLELRELQKSGRIGRIDVNSETKKGKTTAEVTIPSAMGKSETAIIAAALETIERVGPCSAKIKVNSVEDVRVSKRKFIVNRAKELLSNLSKTLPDSQEVITEVTQDVRASELTEYGKERLAAGPYIDESEEIIIVEGRADVINMLRYGIRNVIALNGDNVPETIKDLSKKKVTTLFVDGDRGGDLIIKKLSGAVDIDYVAKAPKGKEVEELTMKEIYGCLRGKIGKSDTVIEEETEPREEPRYEKTYKTRRTPPSRSSKREVEESRSVQITDSDLKTLKQYSEELIGSRGAFILDEELNILGKVPAKELEKTIEQVSEAHAIVVDDEIDYNLARLARNKGVKEIVAKSSRIKSAVKGIKILTSDAL
ncbi:MAG: DNA primase [Candidatus Woesearchaeota archaeon]|nr:MAG: DNA primase [Candidatus Woesearchaeota archaeon]